LTLSPSLATTEQSPFVVVTFLRPEAAAPLRQRASRREVSASAREEAIAAGWTVRRVAITIWSS
jgi:hypothetical protein